jgi:Cof subfamily protein (haloacid dehalogenase superfamily)
LPVIGGPAHDGGEKFVELIVFDLDGTLLNRSSTISDYTRETLQLLQRQGVAYTVATGRTLHGARDLLEGHGFSLPQAFKNGVVIYNPDLGRYSHSHLLTQDEVRHVLEAFLRLHIAPFLFTLEPGERHAIYHPPVLTAAEERLAELFRGDRGVPVLPIAELPADADITNVSALGPEPGIRAVVDQVRDEPGLVAYMGSAIEDQQLCWVDIHHHAGTKGDAVSSLKEELGLERVICFGDSDNDLSMFAAADEAYAPANAKEEVLAAAHQVIGHHDEDGIARFLRDRFNLA